MKKKMNLDPILMIKNNDEKIKMVNKVFWKKSILTKILLISIILLFSLNISSITMINRNGETLYEFIDFSLPISNDINDWEYSRDILLNSTTPYDNYQIKIILDTANFNYSHAYYDGRDLLFLDQNQEELSYWIEEWDNSSYSIIWVKIPDEGTSSFTMYYGNELAISESNGEEVFLLFDDFDGTTLNYSKWTSVVQNYCGISLSNSIIRIYSDAPSATMTASSLGFHDTYVLEGQTYGTQSITGGATFSASEDNWLIGELDWINSTSAPYYENDVLYSDDTDNPSGPLPVRILARTVYYGPGTHYGAWISSFNDTLGIPGTTLRAKLWIDRTGISDIRIDWLTVRKYSETELSYSFGEENDIQNEMVPVLTNPNVTPKFGDQTTQFNFTISYMDEDNNTPSYVNVIINDTVFAMDKLHAYDEDFTDGCIYQFTTSLLPSNFNYSYYFECNDGIFTNATNHFDDLKVIKVNYNSPYLLYPEFSPEFGGLSTSFTFNIWYFDVDDNSPLKVNLTIDTSTFDMEQVNPIDTNATDGIKFSYMTTLNYGLHTLQFNCSDGLYNYSTGWINGPNVNPLIGVESIELLTPQPLSRISSNLINFSWYSLDASFGSVNYTIQVSNRNDFSSIIIQTEDIIETPIHTNYSVLLPIVTGDYYWRVKPTFQNYNGSWSHYAKFTYEINHNIPLLSLDAFTPTEGTETTIFRFNVIYFDSDNNAPNYVRILINGIPHNMTMVDPNDDDFTNGCLFQFLTFIEPSETACIISFECSDGFHQYYTSNFEGPIVGFDEIPDNNLGENNFNSANTFSVLITIGITIGCIIPFIAFTEILTKKVKLGTLSSKKIKKKEIKPK